MRESMKIFVCPKTDCPKHGEKNDRCPDHNLGYIGVVYRRVDMGERDYSEFFRRPLLPVDENEIKKFIKRWVTKP